jgi:hypothetical protein
MCARYIRWPTIMKLTPKKKGPGLIDNGSKIGAFSPIIKLNKKNIIFKNLAKSCKLFKIQVKVQNPI